MVGPLVTAGAERGMVQDFGGLKEVMMSAIHQVYDHKLILWVEDDLFDDLDRQWGYAGLVEMGLTIVTVPKTPTAENLAEIWYDELIRAGVERGESSLEFVRVWETPNCIATYYPRSDLR